MENNFYVYKHTNKVNNKVYIGITSKSDPTTRWGTDGKGYGKSTRFATAIKKYGWDNFSHEILFEGLTKDEAVAKEQELIALYKSNDRKYGYNSTSGGEFFTLTDEVKQKMSKSMMGNTNAKGIVFTEERRNHISESLKGKKFTEERKKKISLAKKGKSHKTICDEGKKHLSNSPYHNAKKKRVYCEETGETYSSIHECAEKLFTRSSATSICAVCRGKQRSYKNYHFHYADDNNN